MLTPGRLRWLQQLEREGIATRGCSSVGYDCMQRGWTDWVVTDGVHLVPWKMLYRAYEPGDPRREEGWTNIGEALTPAGRQILREHYEHESAQAADAEDASSAEGGHDPRQEGRPAPQAENGAHREHLR